MELEGWKAQLATSDLSRELDEVVAGLAHDGEHSVRPVQRYDKHTNRDWRVPQYKPNSIGHEVMLSKSWPANHWGMSSHNWGLNHAAETSAQRPPNHAADSSLHATPEIPLEHPE